jgi:flagellar protein FlaG
MSRAVTPVPPVDPAAGVRSAVGDLGQPAAARPVQEPAQDLRLVIEEDPQSGAFVYKTLDRTTGEVVRQVPREDVLRLKTSDSYVAGEIFAGQA